MDPVAMFKKYSDRIPYMHFKDIDGKVLKKLQETKGTFWDGVREGIFCPLGQGLVDYPAVLATMKEAGFSGVVTIEQDFDNKIDDQERKLKFPAECSKLNVDYLQSLLKKKV